jgi:hypothetical protein
VSPPNRPGRPPLDKDDPSVSVCVRFPAKVYDRVYARAQRDRVSIPEVIRRQVRESNDDRDKKKP